MRKLRNCLTAAFCGMSILVAAQGVPTHPMYVQTGDEAEHKEENTSAKNAMKVARIQRILNFDPANPYSAGINKDGNYNAYNTNADYVDDNFYISRIPLRERFRNQSSQARTEITEDRDKKLCFWTPVGEMTKQWGALPRYNYECDNFGMWQYLDYQGNWGNYLFRVPAALTDVAHKNGVPTGCLKFIDWGAAVNASTEPGLAELSSKENGKYKYAKKLIQYLKFYGIDGIGINPEGSWSGVLLNNFPGFLAECHMEAAKENWPFHVEWYAFVTNSGSLYDGGSSFISDASNWFSYTASDGKKWPVVDVYFLNYNWTTNDLSSSLNNAVIYKADGETDMQAKKRIYAGFDQQGRGWGSYVWTGLGASDAGVVVWGDHARNIVYSASTYEGSSDYAIQTTYPKTQERLFTNGTRNVLNDLPYLNIQTTPSDLSAWHGYSKVTTAKSILTDAVLPFVTRFNLGNGQWLKNEGVTTWNHKWYNLGMQDILPTWRWWVDNGDGHTAATDAINLDFSFDDAYFGGSCLNVHGATTKSAVRLYKTQFTVNSLDDKFSLTFKVKNGNDPMMKMMVSVVGAESTYKYYTIPATGVTAGQWATVNFTAADLGLATGDVIATMGLCFENTPATYSTYLGGMSFIPASFVAAPVQPTILKAQTLKRVYNSVDFKLIWDVPFSGTRPEAWTGASVYNEEVGAWYYEVYIKQEGTQPRLLTTTTSWAAYVVEATLDNEVDQTYQVGVCAVAPDGKTRTEISWTDAQTSELTIIDALTISKNIIKPNEEFVIGFEDPNHSTATINIYNATTGELTAHGDDLLTLKTSLPDDGVYDVEVISGGKTTMSRGLFQITPVETGSLPSITDITASATTLNTGESTDLSFTGDDGTNNGQATVSQGVRINDDEEVKVDYNISSELTNQTWAMWFKPDAYNHGTLGTVLMQKINKNYGGTWTESAWGELSVGVRPATAGLNHNNDSGNKFPDSAISANTDYPPAGTPNYEHNNHVDVITMNHTALPGVWNHLAVVKTGGNYLKIYINGKLAAQSYTSGAYPFNHQSNFYVGGPMTNMNGFSGVVDELQIWSKALTEEEVKESMEGYAAAPSGLVGYFDFEEVLTDASGNKYFPNLGTAASTVAGAYITKFGTENSKSVDVPQNPTVALGVPSLEGSMPITLESVKWVVDGATVSKTGDNTASAEFANAGTYPVKLTLTNSWGSTTKTIEDYIVVKNASGIDGVDNNDAKANYVLYPNPFKETANILFAENGRYVVNVYNADGAQVASQEYLADKGEAAQLSFDGPQGLYYVVVMNNGVVVKSFKVVKE